MTTETIQQQLAEQITSHNKTWGNLLVNLDFGNEASNYWDVSLKPIDISIYNIKNTFTFKNAEFRFDVNSGISYGDDHRVFLQNTFQEKEFINLKITKQFILQN